MNIIQAEVDSLALGINAVRGLPDDRYSSFLRRPVHLPLDLDRLDPALAFHA